MGHRMKAFRYIVAALVVSVASADTYYEKTTIPPTIAANKVLGNGTASTAAPQQLAVGSCSTSSSALIWTTSTGFGCNTSINAATLGSATFANPGAIGGGTPAAGAFTTISATGQITSTLVTGTAPFSVASTTNVANLNASTLSGATFASPGAIGSTAASTGLFTTIGASGLISPTSTVGIKGTIGADSPAAGSVGEVFSIHCLMAGAAAAGSAVSLPVASPGVVTWSSHTFVVSGPANYSCPINFSANGGALPTGLVVGTTYYIIGSTVSGDTFQVADTMAHALAGTNAINFTGAPSGSPLAWIGYLIATTNTVGGAGMTLTAGDWDCSGTAEWQELTNLTVTEYLQGINTSAVIGTIGSYVDLRLASSSLGAASSSYVTPIVQQNVSASTTVYLVEKATFSVGTQNAGGLLRCRRMR